MKRFAALLCAVLTAGAVLTGGTATVVHAQQPLLYVTSDPGDRHAVIRLGPILANSDLRDAALAGLPIRLRVRTELWRDQFFDKLVQTVTWTSILVYEPLSRRYYVGPADAVGPARQYATYDAARAAIEGDLPIRLRPRVEGRYYYTGILEVETLSVSDLQELENWLRGELQPAVEGAQSLPDAIGKGAKRLLIRVLGVPTQRVEARSSRFNLPQ